jgi:glycosyltransferase involved in cell wall biosynthesis
MTMNSLPSKVLIAGGKMNGGVASFAEALRSGFTELGLEAEVASPTVVLTRVRELRDPGILKLLSLAAWYGAPIARRAIWIAHGIPCVANQGWTKTLAIIAAAKAANACSGVQLVEVSEYGAVHMRQIFGVRVDAVIHNPVNPIFLEAPASGQNRDAITFVGRLHRSKNVNHLLPAFCDVLARNPGLRVWIIGDGSLRFELEQIAAGDDRVEFLGELPPLQVRDRLRRTRVFVSACPTEAFGITYVEALSQGCGVAMPATGGGLEIATDLIGNRIQLFRASVPREGVAAAIQKVLHAIPQTVSLASYSPRTVAEAYLAVDARFSAKGVFQGEAIK